MKILNREQIQTADRQTIQHEPIASVALMERAARAFVKAFEEKYGPEKPVYIAAGKGNNGGDGLAIARLLANDGYRVHVILVGQPDNLSPDCQANWEALPGHALKSVATVNTTEDLPPFPKDALLIDALLGSGLDRPLKGLIADVVASMNNSPAGIIAVDIPTGIYCDAINPDPIKIKAIHTFTFELPKLSFMLPEVQDYVGAVTCLPIGLLPDYIANAETTYHWLTSSEIAEEIRPRKPYEHKGNFGHALLMVGAQGTMGAAQLSGEAALRSGTGLLTIGSPHCGYIPLQTSVPEAMVLTDSNETHLTMLPDLQRFNAIGIGPGIGQATHTAAMLEQLLLNWNSPLVLDADALNILSKRADLWKHLPPGSILTPHPGEFGRLTTRSNDSLEQLEKGRNLAYQHQVTVALKGSRTAIIAPTGQVYFNSTGNPGMATGGSGDILTGLLTGLLAQGYEPLTAASIGVFIHGSAGDKAALEKGENALIARDLLHWLPMAFSEVEPKPA